MNYYSNPELARQFGVSRRTVTNWIEQTRQGRLDLELVRDGAYDYISKSPKNLLIMRGIVQQRRKFINKRSLKTAAPQPKLYTLFNDAQVIDLIYSIEKYREVPRQYNYFDEGASLWDKHTWRQYGDTVPNMVTQTIALLDANVSYIDQLFARHERINIIDIGPGNALPIKKLLAHLLETGRLGKYVAIDISQAMLAIAERNIRDWFGDAVAFEGHVRDISRDSLADVIFELSAGDDGSTVNLCLLLGATLPNFRAPEVVLRNIVDSMGPNDYFVYTTGVDSAWGREQFHFSVDENATQRLPAQYKPVMDLLGIEPSTYATEMGFDEHERSRYLRIRLKHPLTIEFTLSTGVRRVDLNKEETILLWRARHNTALEIGEQLNAGGLEPLLMSKTEAHDYLMVIADLQRGH